jgi:hypothetical protein
MWRSIFEIIWIMIIIQHPNQSYSLHSEKPDVEDSDTVSKTQL